MTKNEGEGAEDDVVLEDLPGDVAEGEEDKTDWKALAKKNHGIAKRYQTKLAKTKEKSEGGSEGDGKGGEGKSGKDGDEKAGVLDKLDRAVLRVEKITAKAEVELVEQWMKDTGRDVESILGNKHFQAELKDLRDLAATDEATPEGNKRGQGGGTKDTVEYWLAKGTLPPLDQPELRQKVVNAKIAKEKSGSNFSQNPLQ